MKIAELMLQMPEGETLEKSLAAVMKDRMGAQQRNFLAPGSDVLVEF